MPRYENEYKYTNRFGSAYHTWVVVGARIGMHLHISDQGEEDARKHQIQRFSGGIEIHYRSPPDYMKDDAPSQMDCWVLGGPCWHDGSSLQAMESWIPFWKSAPHDHERMFRALEHELEERDPAATEGKEE